MKSFTDILSISPLALAFSACGLLGAACAHSSPSTNGNEFATAPNGTRENTRVVQTAQNDQCNDWEIYFATDAAAISPETRTVLTRLARCIRRGDVRNVSVVGSADPRGTSNANLTLGQQRADAIRAVLVEEGCDPSVVHSISTGEFNSTNNPNDFATERRVSIRTLERPN